MKSTQIRNESYFQLRKKRADVSQEKRALEYMYGTSVTNHSLARALHIPITSATRLTCGLRKKTWLFDMDKRINVETGVPNTVMGLTPAGMRVAQDILYEEAKKKELHPIFQDILVSFTGDK